MLQILLLTLTLLKTSQALIFNISAAVQNQNQTFFSYLPYISACNYTQANMYPGEVRIGLFDSMSFYSEIRYKSGLEFWADVKNGYSIMAILPDIIATNYSGMIVYDSPLQQHLTRSIVLYTVNEGNLTFYYTLPSFNIRNTVLSLNTTQVINIQLTAEAEAILTNCTNIGQQSFASLGNNTFMFICGSSENGFIFTPGFPQNTTILNMSALGVGNYQITTNPTILRPPRLMVQSEYWSAVILVTNSSILNELYFFSYNFQFNNYSLVSFKQMRPAIDQIINRIWGLQIKRQFKTWMSLFSTFNLSQNAAMFPGDVVSVFVNQQEHIFVEYTTVAGANFLCVFDNDGNLYWNVTYLGSIVLYSNKAIYIYDKKLDELYEIQVDRPIYMLNVSAINDTTVDHIYPFNITIPCEGHEDLQIYYKILWTTPDFPTALILQKNSAPIYTTDVIYGFELSDRFEVIGPDFQLLVNSPPNFQVIIIDSSTVVLNETVVGLVDVFVDENNNLDVIFITHDGVYQVTANLVIRTLAIEPCGFNNIESSTKQTNAYVITNSNNQTCICTNDFISCQLGTSIGSLPPVNSQEDTSSYSQYSTIGSIVDFGTYSIRRNLYGLIKQGYIISILENNTVFLINIKSNEILDQFNIECDSYNQTNGDLYIREFFDPFLIVYCERTQSLYQFVVRNNQLVPEREIPLYRFRTRTGQFTFFPAFSFLYIAVDPVIDIYPIPTNCCVLRLDPCQFTVSVIIQIIEASSILAATNYRNIDVALFKSNSQPNTQYIIKAYFPNVWVTINQTCNTCVVDQNNITVIFESESYNFAASFDIQTTFNLTQVNLSLINDPQQDPQIQNLNLMYNETGTEFGVLMVGQTNYNLSNYVCGPIFESIFYRKSANMTNLEVIQTDVLTKAKKIGKFGIELIQLINPSKFGVPNLTLNQLILAVSMEKMYVYAKVKNNVQLVNITEFHLPERRCTYYLLDILNQTAATLTSNCQGVNYDFKSPLLTINYNETTGFTSSYQWVILPMDLRQMYTIVRGNNQSTLVVGIIQGPMNAATGRLYLCDGSQCSSLFVSTADTFLINYAAQLSNNLYIIMSIDYQTVQIFINPEVQPNSKSIPSNYTVNYTKYITQPYCSVLKILNMSITYSYNIFSCSKFYYYVKMYYASGKIQIINRFARYSQCALEDQFGPSALYNEQGLQMFFAQCRQNDYIVKLQTYETINSSLPIIYTGYMQVFTMTGPLGPSCSNTSISPSKIIPLSSRMGYPLYMTYSIKNYDGSITHKFLYTQISGILIDNIISYQPSLRVQYQPFLLQYDYPTIQFYAVNQYHRIRQNITTGQPPTRSFTVINILAFAVFSLSNIITILCLICFLCQRNQRQAILRMQARDSTNVGPDNELEYDESFRPTYEARQREVTGLTTTARKNTKRPSQIQMFFVKKK